MAGHRRGRAVNGRRLAIALAALLGGALASAAALGAELLVEGQVLDVTPVTQPGRQSPGFCDAPKPGPSAGLVALLAWDLRATCASAPAAEPEAYRVVYRWDGRTYSRIMRSPPGDTVRLRVRLD